MAFLHMSAAALSATLLTLGAPGPVVLLAGLAAGWTGLQATPAVRLQMAAVFAAAVLSAFYHEAHHQSALDRAKAIWVVTFADDLVIEGDRLRATVREEKTGEPLLFSYRIQSREEKEQLEERVRPGLTCRLQAPAGTPDEAGNPGEFDYRAYLKTRGIFHTLSPRTFSLEQCVQRHSLFLKPAAWRAASIQQIKHKFPAPLSSAAAALLFGDRSGESDGVQEDYERLGIVHILSISGLHVSLLTGLVFYLLIRAGLTREHARFLLLLVLPLYALLAGASSPVMRACLMAAFLLGSTFSNAKLTAASALGLAFLLMLFINPFSLFQAGFQLSFLVTFALVLSAGVLLKQAGNAIRLSVFISVISQLAALPVLLYHFSELSVIAPLANLLFVPFYSFFMLPALLCLFLLSFFLPIGLLAGLVNEVLVVMNKVAAFMADAPWAVLTAGQPSFAESAVLAAAVFVSFLLWEHTGKMRYSLWICVLLLAGLTASNRFSSQGEITFLDVGQGDSIFIQLPYNQGIYLIDTGGQVPFEKEAWAARRNAFSVGEDTVVPFLKRKGVTKLDKLIVTHADFDHAGAAADVLSAIPADEIIISPGSGGVEVMNSILKTGLPVREGIEGERWEAGAASFQILAPDNRRYEGNNDSLVLYAEMGGASWLFTGDLEEAGEAELIRQYNLDVDWLKVGHHGSKTSSSAAFIKAVQPAYAVISVGANNRYGHPHESVLDTLVKSGARIYRTDRHGAVTYTFQGSRGAVTVKRPGN